MSGARVSVLRLESTRLKTRSMNSGGVSRAFLEPNLVRPRPLSASTTFSVYRIDGALRAANLSASTPFPAEPNGFIWPIPNLSTSRAVGLRSAGMSDAPLVPQLRGTSPGRGAHRHPGVLIHGPRHSGKTTLAQAVGKRRDYIYFSFDDDVIFGSATADPVGFVSDLPERVILDEVQRAPGIFTALKSAVDRRRTPGRFLLTGSSNVLLVPALADSLAGRMGILRLHLLAQCELAKRTAGFLDVLFEGAFKARQAKRLGKALAERIADGGYPTALARATSRRPRRMVSRLHRDARAARCP